MKIPALPFCLILVALSLAANPQQHQHPLDAALTRALDEPANQSTHGTVRLYEEYAVKWEKELKRVLEALTRKLPPADRAALEAAQKQWQAWAEAEKKTIETVYGRLQGTMYRPMAVYAELNLIRQRVMQLAHYLTMLDHAE